MPQTLLARVTKALDDYHLGVLTAEDTELVLSQMKTFLEQCSEQPDHLGRVLKVLSLSELDALAALAPELNDKGEGLMVASKIAERCNITRSVICNALRKMESAGIIQTWSLGMKGTRVKALIPDLRERLLQAIPA